MKSWLDFIWDIYVNGVQKVRPKRVNYVGSITAVETNNGEDLELTFAGSSAPGAPTDAHYVVTQPDSNLTNAHEVFSSSSIEVAASANSLQLNCIFGTTAGTVCQGNDSRLSNSRVASSILGATCKPGATFSTNGEAVVLNDAGTLEPIPVYCKYTMGSEGAIPFAGQDASAGIQYLDPNLPEWALTVNQSGLPSYAPVGPWRRSRFDSLDDGWSMSISSGAQEFPYPTPRVGLPIRIADKTPIVYTDSYSNYAGIFAGISGTIFRYADSRGRIYPSLIADGSGYFHLNFYSDSARTKLFGHTATFNSVGSKAFVADNGCGLSGTVTIAGTLAANASSILQLFKYGVISSVVGDSITWSGPMVTTPMAIWIGDQSLIRPLDIVIQGAYAGVTSNQAIFDRTGAKCFCDFAAAHLAIAYAIHGTADTTTQPKISLMHNGTLTIADGSASAVSTSRNTVNQLVDSARCVTSGQLIELRVQKLGTGDARDLSAVAIYVLE